MTPDPVRDPQRSGGIVCRPTFRQFILLIALRQLQEKHPMGYFLATIMGRQGKQVFALVDRKRWQASRCRYQGQLRRVRVLPPAHPVQSVQPQQTRSHWVPESVIETMPLYTREENTICSRPSFLQHRIHDDAYLTGARASRIFWWHRFCQRQRDKRQTVSAMGAGEPTVDTLIALRFPPPRG